MSSPAQSFTPPLATAAGVAVLLLGPRPAMDDAETVLRTRLDGLQVARAASLTEAMIAVARVLPALAVLDPALCDALEIEFVDHLLNESPAARVMVLGAPLRGTPWPRHPRLAQLPLADLLPALSHWAAEWSAATTPHRGLA